MRGFFDIDNWREIGATLSRNKLRTFLTGFGIFWGTAMLAMLMGGADGLRGMMMRNFDGFATNMVGLFAKPTTMSYRGFNKGMTWNMNLNDVRQMRKDIEGIDASSIQINMSTNVSYKNKSRNTQMQGVEAGYFKIQLPLLYEGRLLSSQDDASEAKVALIGQNLASQLFPDESPIGKYVNAGGVYLQIVGVVGQKDQVSMGGRLEDSIIMPYSVARRAYNLGDKVYFFMITMKSGYVLDDLKPAIYRILRSNHPIHPDDTEAVEMFDVSEMFAMVDDLFVAINLLALFVGVSTLMAGIIGVGNIMWIIVKERTHEIGIRRAIGARPANIIEQILSEGVALTLVAGLFGIVFATIGLHVADNLTNDPITGSAGFGLTFWRAVGIMITFVILGAAAGLIPAIKAMKIKPIEAINDK
ncbi:MAG: ABC transporter permease [Muribaculaceae bacterium]|nr:ABC transporter permease [Muribaculaceae bacterium]